MTKPIAVRGPALPFERLCRMNPLQLAYAGDTVYDLYVRTELLCGSDANVRALHRAASARVCARAQAEALARIEPMLTGEERDVVRRGRNAKSRSIPKNADPADYGRATALEALIGYLYLAGRDERLDALLRAAIRSDKEEVHCQEPT